MIIGVYRMNDRGFAIDVEEYEAGWSFLLQGDDADHFREEWKKSKDYGSSFGEFLQDHEYNTLVQ